MLASQVGCTSIRDRGHSNASYMKGMTDRRRRNGMAVRRHTNKRSKEHVGSGEQLLPGIPNEITLDLITPKLPWRALHVLSSVSRCWQEAIRTNQVYEARVRANSTETLIVHVHIHLERDDTIALYSTSEKCCHELPPIPCLPRGILISCKCIALDGRVYVLGGRRMLGGRRVLVDGRVVTDSASIKGYYSSGEVYVLDLAGQREWKQRASMLEARYDFGCGVMDGKIYVFGGINERKGAFGRCTSSEVYDTQENAWSPIMPMTEKRHEHRVATVGKELFLYHKDITTVGVYNPAKNEWRLVEHFCEEKRLSPLFTTKEKFYLLSHSGIDVYDVEQHSWINRHANSFATLEPALEVFPLAILAVKDELLLQAACQTPSQGFDFQSFQCKGFDTEKKEMVWEDTNCPVNSILHFRCSIQL